MLQVRVGLFVLLLLLCRNYPTAANIAKKRKLETDRQARGEVAQTPLYKYACISVVSVFVQYQQYLLCTLFPGLPCFRALFCFRVLYRTQTKELKRGRPGNEATIPLMYLVVHV